MNIEISFKNGHNVIILNVDNELVNNIINSIGKTEGNEIVTLYNEEEFICSFFPNEILSIINLSYNNNIKGARNEL